MSYTLEDIRLEVREELQEADDETDPTWSNAYINKWINRYSDTLARVTKCLEGYGTITTIADQANYSLPTNHFEPILVKMDSITELTPKKIVNLRDINPTLSGTPSIYIVWDDEIYFYAIPSTAYTMNIWSYMTPTALSADSDVSDINDEQIIEILVKMVIARCRKVEEEFGVANQYYGEIPYDVSDFLFTDINRQEQYGHHVRDVMGYGG